MYYTKCFAIIEEILEFICRFFSDTGCNGIRIADAIATGIGKEAADKFQNFFYYGKTLGIYNTFWIAMIVFVIFFFVLSKTRSGRHIYAIGSNVDAAKLSGVDVVATTIKTYLISAACSCLVGLILCAQAGMGNMEAGNMYEMYGVAAGVIGRVSPLGGTGILLGTLSGAADMADIGKWSEHDRGAGGYSARCDWCDRSSSRTSGCSGT